MKKIRLKDEYPWFSDDEYIEVADEIAEVFTQFARAEQSYKRKMYYHRAFYSLDAGDGIEKEILFVSASAQELYERKVTQEGIYRAISQLSEKQAKRIYAHFFQEMTFAKIARVEGVNEASIRGSIARGMKKIEGILKKLL